MIFNRTSWYRYSESVGGSTIDFLMYFKNMEYKEAVVLDEKKETVKTGDPVLDEK